MGKEQVVSKDARIRVVVFASCSTSLPCCVNDTLVFVYIEVKEKMPSFSDLVMENSILCSL